MKNIKNTSAFTLIEMIVVMTILAILAVGSYGNYLLYQKKEMIRQAQREISKTIIEARNMAINGYDNNVSGTDENKHIGIEIKPYDGSSSFIDSGNVITICSFPLSTSSVPIGCPSNPNSIIQTRTLPKNIIVSEVKDINGDIIDKFFGYFEAVTGDETYTPSGDRVKFKVSYANSTGYLTGCVEYYTMGHTSDFTKCL